MDMSIRVSGLAGSLPGQLGERDFRLFRDFIYQFAGISLSDAKRPLVAGRLGKRIRQLGLGGYGEYFKSLQADLAERQMAVDLLTTNETYFFREPKHFDFLRHKILPGLPRNGPVRIWSGACSSGEEPYTIAMVLAEALGGRPWEIVASDLSSRVLEQARSGQYPLEDAEGIPKPLLRKYFLKGVGSQEGTFLVGQELRDAIHFRQINLNTTLPPAMGCFDVIFLRNVMIYFDVETKRQVVRRLLPLLKPGGYFIVSHSENLNGITDALASVQPSIYRKENA